MRDVVAVRGLVWYYLATPLFAVLDLGLGLSFRVAGLERPLHRGLYYLVLVALGLVLQRRPTLAPWAGMAESVTNLFLLLLSILLPVWAAPDRILAGETVEVLSAERVLNALVVGLVLIVAFQRHAAAAAPGARRR